jgi:MFS family permease
LRYIFHGKPFEAFIAADRRFDPGRNLQHGGLFDLCRNPGRFYAHLAAHPTQAGWISSAFFAGYVAAVPLLVGLTDRFDARRIYYVACC